MEQRTRQHQHPFRVAQSTRLAISLSAAFGAALAATPAQAQNAPNPPDSALQRCVAQTGDETARLSCFDQWAAQLAAPAPRLAPVAVATGAATTVKTVVPPTPVIVTMEAPTAHDCRNPRFSELSRYWELEPGTDCGTFSIRGYKPISLSWIGSDGVNTQPSSPSPNHTATQPIAYSTNEARIQVSVRTKIAQGLLTMFQPSVRDSLWFGYTQQSNWQLFNSDISRPFRTTDHSPEITYIYPLNAELPGGWRLRYGGFTLSHQSNGQSEPLSRSWNRTILSAGMEKGNEFVVKGELWNRLPESEGSDDNPDISDYVGRAEIAGLWNVNRKNTLGVTLRHSLRANDNGSVKLEWLRDLSDTGVAGGRSGLRFHTQVFTGYGDSLVDYNRRRTVLSLGLSLIDW
jgi:phospholipase A1